MLALWLAVWLLSACLLLVHVSLSLAQSVHYKAELSSHVPLERVERAMDKGPGEGAVDGAADGAIPTRCRTSISSRTIFEFGKRKTGEGDGQTGR